VTSKDGARSVGNGDETDPAPAEAWEHIGWLLWRASRLFVGRMIAALESKGYDGLTRANMNIFPVLDPEGTRLTTAAARLGVSKQTIMRLVDDLERHAYISRVADPRDARAKIICFTERGRALLLEGEFVKVVIEKECLAALAPGDRERFHLGLRSVIGVLETFKAS
jgi:DNA-binding MarR family transcriptional regulator